MSANIDVHPGEATPFPKTKAKLGGLQAGRAAAAIMVVAFHANTFILPQKLFEGGTAALGYNMGYAGVEFFFVLSGFIMYHIHSKDFGQSDRASVFIKRRIYRIYPIYWVILTCLLILYALAPGRGPDNANDVGSIVASYFLFPMPDFPIMRVAWTLQHEMLFYFVFICLIISCTFGTFVFGAWMLACFVPHFFADLPYPFDFLLSEYNLLFLFGMIAAAICKELPTRAANPVLIGGAVLFFAVGLSEAYGLVVWDKAIRTWSFGIAAAAVTVGLAVSVIEYPRWLIFLGDASYSIYLVHLPAMSIFVVLLLKLGAPWSLPPDILIFVVSGVSVVVGSIAYLTIERPLMLYFRGREKKSDLS